MKLKRKDTNPQTSLSLRLIAGAYLLYIDYLLIKEYGTMKSGHELLNLIVIIFFGITGILIVVTSAISLIKLYNKKKYEDDAVNSESNLEKTQEEVKEDFKDSVNK
jgi:hypothetical protein